MRIGISGHQKIEPSASICWVNDTLKTELVRLGITTGVSCLAAGADQIFASIVLELGAKLEAVIPCKNYESAFENNTSLSLFRELSDLSASHHRLAYIEPSKTAFLKGGQRVVEVSECMFFVWDGEVAEGLGGTGDIVSYALERGVPFVHLNPINQSVTLHE